MSPTASEEVSRQLHAAPVTFREAGRAALRWGMTAALTGGGAFAAMVSISAMANQSAFPLRGLVLGSTLAAMGCFLIVYVTRMLWLSQSLMDRTFRIAAFGATFFGLAMLVVFLTDLTLDTIRWFHETPKLVEARNELIRDKPKAFVANRMMQIDKEMEIELRTARDEKEKTEIREFYEKEIKPAELAKLQVTLAELEAAVARDVRPDPNAGEVFGHFMTAGPSDMPEDAGIFPALLGSLWLAVITILVAVPLGVGTAIYLEEYKQSGILARVIQININNLAGVPSVVFGILGAFVFVEMIFKNMEGQVYTPYLLETLLGQAHADSFMRFVFGDSIAARNVIGGGMTLGLLTLPVVIVASQEAIRAVPQSIRHGALALGATQWQVVQHHVIPAARPGILTGTILAMSRALGEAAPLVLFGALLFVNQNPSLFSRFTVVPMQIFGWADRPDEMWRYNAAIASVVLLVTILTLNGFAIFLRQRAQRGMKW